METSSIIEEKMKSDLWEQHPLHTDYEPKCSTCYSQAISCGKDTMYPLTCGLIQNAERCEDCNGQGIISVPEKVYANEPHMADIGERLCPNCSGEKKEPNSEIVIERILEKMNAPQEELLKSYFMSDREYGGVAITKDNCEDLFEAWLSKITLEQIKQILK